VKSGKVRIEARFDDGLLVAHVAMKGRTTAAECFDLRARCIGGLEVKNGDVRALARERFSDVWPSPAAAPVTITF
jgi:hypothetical protein